MRLTLGAPMNAIRAELARLADENGGHLTPEIVLTAASEPQSIIGDLVLDSSISAAAREYHLDQCRRLIRVVWTG